MQTKNVFLDTSAIIAQNFNYESPSLKALGDLAASGGARLVTTTITIREVESQVRKRVAEARLATERFKHHAILKNVADPALEALLGKTDVLAGAEETLIKQLHDFIDRTKTKVVPLSMASSEEVFEKYFKGQPPFGKAEDAGEDEAADEEGGKGKSTKKGKAKDRKGEFPDAFVISALENWSKKKGEKLLVVSQDSDFEEHCKKSPNLIRLGRVGEAVSELNLNRHRQAVERSAQRNIQAFAAAIESEFENLGFYLDDEDGDVNGVSVKDVEFLDELSLIGIVENVATFEVTASVAFLADVSYENMDTAVSDGEGGHYALETVEVELERAYEFTVTVEVLLDAKGKFVKVSAVHFPPEDVAISANEYDDYG
jgi:hypothetical protein